ncbi:FAD/NAD(P)-binding protein [Actinokineospora sp.]|uniref:FAD/NAD(P)-binding protein n=1 Tax=Actinokineospora sp. TaxID=1872133 RepID=UPI004037D86C
MSSETIQVCVIGAGPRGLSVLERLCANVAECVPAHRTVRIHLVDPYVHQGGRVWRADQDQEFLMNTVSAQVTMFLDDSVECAGPVVAGPSLYEWARFVTLLDPFNDLPEGIRREAADLGPNSYPSRAFYGHYLGWTLRHIIRTTAPNVTIETHALDAVDVLDAEDGTQIVALADGRRITEVHAVVLAQGHVGIALSKGKQALADFAAVNHLHYVPPSNPADVDLDFLAPDEPVILRGLGLNFFDHMAMLTLGRGGRFQRGADGRLTYRRSGREPKLIAGSRRGIPYHARGENQKGVYGRHLPYFLTPAVIADMRCKAERGEPVSFAADLWWVIDAEVRAVYYATLVGERECTCTAAEFLREFRALDLGRVAGAIPLVSTVSAAESALLDRFGVPVDQRWDWTIVANPCRHETFRTAPEFTSWLVAYLRNDVQEARRGNVRSALKAALDVLRDLRNEIRLVVDHGGLSGDSYRDELERWYMPLNAFLSIGPPVQRVEQMVALIESGVLQVVGPGMTVECRPDGAGFLVRSALVPDGGTSARVLIEARLQEMDIRRTTDPLIRNLLAGGEARTNRIPNADGTYYETGGLAVTPRPYRLVQQVRGPHPRRFAFGVPTETVHWLTAAGIRPGVNSVILGDADAIARAGLLVSTALHGIAEVGAVRYDAA